MKKTLISLALLLFAILGSAWVAKAANLCCHEGAACCASGSACCK